MLEVETTGFSSGPQVDADDTSSESHIFADLNGMLIERHFAVL